jgi:prepilin-type N-terminal cleavage/methylation domain-containing protein/prepilin-type processing-associated H-X9-DG protein
MKRISGDFMGPTDKRVARRAFTLVELLVVIAIIGTLVGLLLPAVQQARASARLMQCKNNLKQIALAIQNYHTAHKAQPKYHAVKGTYAVDRPGATWGILILPYLEQQALYDSFDFKVKLNRSPNAEAAEQVVATYVCPQAESAANPIFEGRDDLYHTHAKRELGLYYPVSMGPTDTDTCPFCPGRAADDNFCCQGSNYGTNLPLYTIPHPPAGTLSPSSVGMFGRYNDERRFSEVTDGLSNTFIVGETLPRQCAYGGAFAPNFSLAGTTIPLNTFEECPGPPDCHNLGCGFKSDHTAGANFAMADGSVHFIDETIEYTVFNYLGTRAGGEFRN